jgi:hypothetical protein
VSETITYVKDSGWQQSRRGLRNIVLRWFGHIQRRPMEAPIRSGIISQTGTEKKRKTKLDIGVNEERFDVLDYH